jgi:3-isopropylmalate/(R)-2-methylmalate dehydratase small subunit
MKTNFPIIIFGENFGCDFSQEHTPIALEADGVRTNVMVLYYACTFFGNCSATGELYPWESVDQLCKELETAQKITIDVEQN